MKKIVTYIILILALCGVPFTLFAQGVKCTISGKVIDKQNSPVAYASVAIYQDKTPIAGVVTDSEGKFTLKTNHSTDEYRLAIEFIGYEKYEGLIVPNKAHIDLGTILLKEAAVEVAEVVVTGKEVAQKSTVEHTTINASANMASSKGTAIDILRSASSVSVSNDEIAIRGNKNILVLMDGVPTTASDLSTIPAANIQSIEVITNPDASHDAGGTGGIINIISKRNRAEGFSSMVAANYGFNHFANGNIALSYNRSKTSWQFSYNVKYEDDVVNSTLNRKVHSTGYEVFQQMQSTRYTFNNNISLGADFRINPRNRLSVDAKLIIPRLNIKQDLHNTFVDYTEERYNDVTWNRVNIEGSVAYTHIIKPEVSDLTIRASVSKIWGERPSHYFVGGVENNRSVSGGSPFIPSLQADYKHKFGVGTLSAGAKLTYRQNDVYHEFYEFADGEWIYSEAMSKDMLHTELTPAAYAMFASRIGKKFSYKVGLRGEFSTVTLNSKHEAINERENDFFVAPSLSATYKIAENQDLSLALSRRIGRPTYPQLIPYMSMVDATTYEQGNMHLDSEKATKVDLSYSLHSEVINLFVNGSLNYTTDYISQVTKMEDERLITTYANADKDLKTGVDLSLKVTPAKWFNFSVGANTYYVTTEGVFEDAHIDNQGWTNNSNLLLNFVPWKGGDI
ncbi:MAG: TonB-dependent receptor, partial [Alistipes sp.]|nr:TonB-dependent receptor [Alistipes sp.]